MGNHNYWNGLSVEKAQDRFLQKSGMDSLYYHKKVNGYDLMTLNQENGNTHGLYSLNQINWLGEKLKVSCSRKSESGPTNLCFSSSTH